MAYLVSPHVLGPSCVTIRTALSQVLGAVGVDLDSRFDAIRTRETTMGNFMCDIFNSALSGDLCLVNSGCFRSDQVRSCLAVAYVEASILYFVCVYVYACLCKFRG